MKKFRSFSPIYILLSIIGSVLISSCGEDDPNPSGPPANADNVRINEWVLSKMEYWYLWNNDLAKDGNKNLDPAEYFESLLSDEDRFSWIQDNYQELLNSLKGVNKEAGYEFVLYKDKTDPDKVIAQIVYVKPGSSAESAGLVRGDIISHINDQQMTVANYKDVIKLNKENHTIRYKSVNVESETFSEEKTASLTTTEYSENPNYMHKIVEAGDRKIGYYVYNLFAGGPDSESTVYDDEMDQIFTSFKSAGITDLVLDLRYNTGGAETSANNLASNIGKGVNSTKVFAKREYNSGIETAIIASPTMGREFLTKKFLTKTSNIGDELRDNRVYILTSSRSASASELVINSLKPYMDVFIIGDTTYGKNVGSISLYDEEDPKNKWGIQPIVVKIYNSLGQSDYTNGFAPNVLHKDNRLFLYPLGDPREVLLGHAIGQITGTATTGRAATKGDAKEIIGHSLDQNRRSFNLIIDEDFRKH